MKGFLAVLLFFGSSGLALANGLDELAKAMGSDEVKTIEYSGQGFSYALGQSAVPTEAWPKMNLKFYRFTANYDTQSMDEEFVLTQFLEPARGGGRQPIRGEMKRRSLMSGEVGWTYREGRPSAARNTVGSVHSLWTSPHGVIKKAQAENAPVKTEVVDGKTFKTVSFGEEGVFAATAWFDERNLLVKTESRVANPVLGDMPVATTYSGYQEIDGIKFPTKISETSWGFPTLELNVIEVEPNAPADITAPPGLALEPERVKVDKVAEGVWFLTGGSHNSVAIEMADHMIVFEGPLHDQRSLAVMNAIEQTISGKPIRFVVNTHHHFDHSGGLRGYAARGATIVTDAINKPFYDRVYAAPHTIEPDELTKSGKKAKVVGFDDKHVMRDGKRALELYRLRGNQHNEGLIVGYLPAAKILMVADAYSARGRPLDKPDKQAGANTANLWENLVRLNLDVETVLPIHGRKVDFQQLKFAAGQP